MATIRIVAINKSTVYFSETHYSVNFIKEGKLNKETVANSSWFCVLPLQQHSKYEANNKKTVN